PRPALARTGPNPQERDRSAPRDPIRRPFMGLVTPLEARADRLVLVCERLDSLLHLLGGSRARHLRTPQIRCTAQPPPRPRESTIADPRLLGDPRHRSGYTTHPGAPLQHRCLPRW